MRQNNFENNRLIVCIDCSLPVFSGRLIRVLADLGIKTEALVLSEGKLKALKNLSGLLGSKSKIVHFLYGGYPPLVYIIPKLFGKKVIVHWIGTDVLDASSQKRKRLFWGMAHGIVSLHLTDFEPLAEELKSLRIDAAVISLVPDVFTSQENIAWPTDNRVLAYMPEKRPEFYGSNLVFQLAEELADLKFLVIGHSGKGAPQLPNVQYLGVIDNLEPVWQQTKIYLRLTKHDGLSNMVLEALARGRHVIWSQKFPHCYYARTLEEARNAVQNILKLDKPNIEGTQYARAEFDPLKIGQVIKQKYLELLSPGNSRG